MRALRSLARSPGYTLIALVTLALGIGVNTSMFSMVEALLFRSAPYPDANRLVQITYVSRQGEMQTFSDLELREVRAHAAVSFSALTTMGYPMYALAEPGRPAERVRGISLSAEMMETFRTPALVGRTFTAEEFQPGKTQAVLLSEGFWQMRFGGDREVIGRTLRLDGELVTVVGVMPASFDYKLMWGNIALWRPLEFTKDQRDYRSYRAFALLGRLAPGVTPDAAAAQLAPLAARQEKDYPADYPGLRYRVTPLHETTIDNTGRGISWMLLGLSGFVLLIACANLANLQLARATAALRDFAIRSALGASRARLVAQQLGESVLLSLGGGVLGVVVALWLNSLLERYVLIDGAPGFHAPINLAVLGLTLLVSLLAGVGFGLAPALFASRTDVGVALKQQSRSATSSRGQHRLRHVLIVGEIALALVLLGGAAVMNRSFEKFLHRDIGWDANRVLTGLIPLPEARFDNAEKRTDFYRKIETRLAALPGVERATLASSLPLFSYSSDRPVFTDAPAAGSSTQNPAAAHIMVTPGYFATLGIPVLEGRDFPADIKIDGPQYVLVNKALAQKFWPGESAIGRRLGSVSDKETVWREVIGVVGDVQSAANYTDNETRFHVYRPLVQEPWSTIRFAIRSAQPAALTDSVRRAVAEIDSDLPADQVGTIRQFVDRVQHNFVVVGRMLAGFALLGLVLAAIGLYGVISNLVVQRTPEFGIRLALGAQPRDVLLGVLGRGLRLSLWGLAIGFAGAWGLSAFLRAIMPRLAQPDPLSLVGVAVLLFAVALIACWLPAHRATRTDPLTALRAD